VVRECHLVYFYALKAMKTTLAPLKCIKGVDEKKCTHSELVKNGKTRYGHQRYKCRICGKTLAKYYLYKAYEYDTNSRITNLLKEGVGIRSTSRLLSISANTVIRRIVLIAKSVRKPMIETQQTYELDELRTYVGNKKHLSWIAYAIRKDTKEVVDFNIGRRSNEMLGKVINTLLNADARKVYTDKLINYKYLLPEKLHSTKLYGINHIERKNLTLRTHLKRLARKTICYSKSLTVLTASIKIYFWG
jgi:insertion element IS1 protein InsB